MPSRESEETVKKSGSWVTRILIILIIPLVFFTGIASFLLLDFATDLYEARQRQMTVYADGGEGAPKQEEEQPKVEEEKAEPLDQQIYRISNSNVELTTQEIAKLRSEVVRIETSQDQGSGVVISEKGYVVTNWHVVKDESEITVYFQNQHRHGVKAEIVKYDENRDLALLHLRSFPDGVEPGAIAFGDPKKLMVGDKIVAIGSPRGLMNTVSEGIVSAFREGETVNYIQITAPLSPGSSGGALLNSKGELVGINTFKVVESENLSFAVSASDVIKFLDEL